MRSHADRGTAVRAAFGALVAVLLGVALALGSVVPTARAAGTVDLTVTAATKTGSALSGMTVTAIPVANYAPDAGKDTVEALPVPGKAGTYLLTGLEEDVPYALYFRSSVAGSFDQFLGGSPWIDEAEYFTATEPGAASLDLTLATNSVITGKVTNSAKAALKSVTVTAYRFNGSTWDWFDETVTASTGVYTLRNIDPGSYKLEISSGPGVNYQTVYSGNRTSFASAVPLYVGLGATVSHNVVAPTGGVVSGRVTFKFPPGPGINSTIAFPADGVKAYAYRLNDGTGFTGINWSAPYYESRVTTISSSKIATWTIAGLPAGRYVVKLYDHQYGDLAERWVSPSSLGTAVVSSASIFTVSAGRTTTATSTTLLYANQVPTPSVTITVRDEAAQPVVGADVVVFSNDNEDYYGSGMVTDAFGQVSILRLPIGSYDVVATHPDRQTTTVVRTIVSNAVASWSVTMPARGAFSFTEAATATGPDLKVGSTFTVNAETTLDDGVGVDAAVRYQYHWYRDGQPIFGGTGQTYTAQSADVGRELTVIVRVKQELDQFFATDYSILGLATVGTIVAGDAPVNSSAPWISSPTAPAPGVTVTANAGVWNLTGLKFSYQWYRNGTPIGGAINRTYVLTPTDGGASELTVVVTASKPGHAAAAPIETDAVSVGLLAAPTQSKGSVVSSTKKSVAVGSTRYSASLGSWKVPGLSYSIQWFADGVAISGTTGATSVVLADASYVGQAIEMRFTASKLGYLPAERIVLVRKGAVGAGTTVAVTSVSAGGDPVDSSTLVQLGTVLRATPSLTLPPSGASLTYGYTWFRSSTGAAGTFTAITGATRQDYTVTSADLGKVLQVRVSPVSNKYTIAASTLTAAGRAVARTELTSGVLPGVTVTGSTSVGTTHSTSISGAWPVSGVTLSYRWLACTALDCSDTSSSAWVPVAPAATKSTYVPTAAMAGRSLLVQVTASKSGFVSAVVRSAPVELQALTEITSITPPSLTGLVAGHAVVGKPITATIGRYDVASPVRTLQWQSCDWDVEDCLDESDWVSIAGATKTTYTPTSTGTMPLKVRVVETMSKGALTPAVTASAAVEVWTGTLVRTVTPKVTVSGTTYTVTSAGAWSPAATSMHYEWFVDGALVRTGSSVTFSSSASQSVIVVATAIRPHYTSSPVTIVVRKGTGTSLTSTAITGNAYGQTLVAPTPFVYAASLTPGPTYTYQWYSNGIAIRGATKATLAPSTGYIGRTITVRITATSPYFNTRVVTSPGVVLQKAAAPSGSVTLQGTAGIAPGSRLSLALSGWPSGFTASYAWQTSPNGTTWTTVSRASTYTLSTAQPGLQVRAVYTLTRTGYTTATVVTAPEVVQWLGPLATTTPAQIVGSGKLGETLTVSPGAWNASGLVFSYQWMRDGIDMPGVTGTTYVPTASTFGTDIQVRVTATRAGYQPATSLSNVVTVGEATAPLATTKPAITRSGLDLRTTPGVWNVDGLAFTYQWAADGVPIEDATAREYRLTGTEVGPITVTVTATRTGYATGTSTSTALIIG